MAVTMHDVARHAGVSQRTVSNVVTGAVPVRPATRAKVEASIEALGYRPNFAARALRAGRPSSVTLAVPGFAERYFADLAESVVREAEAHQLRVLVATTDGDRGTELSLIRGEGVITDGVIMSAVGLLPDDAATERPALPLVLVGDREAGGTIAHVGADNRQAAYDAVAHLLRRGRRRVLVIGGAHGDSRTAELREEGWRAAHADLGVPLDESLLATSPWTYGGGARAVRERHPSWGDVDAVFAMNDSVALGALGELVRLGHRVPEDVAVVGFDTIGEGVLTVPELSSVGPRPRDLARVALAELRAQLDGTATGPAEHAVPHRLVLRGSTGD